MQQAVKFPVHFGRREDCFWLREMERIVTRVGQGEHFNVSKPCHEPRVANCCLEKINAATIPNSREVHPKFTEDDVRILKEKLRDLYTNEPQGEDDMEMIIHIAEAISSNGSPDDGGTSKVELTIFDEFLEAPPKEEKLSPTDHIRRTAVALTGGTLTVAGVALIPCPVLPGALFIYGGLLVLATEFDEAKVAVESLKEPLTNLLADEVGRPPTDPDRFNRAAWEGIIDYRPQDGGNVNWIDAEFAALMESKKDEAALIAREAERRNKNQIKQVIRKILFLDRDNDIRLSDKGG